MLFEGLENEKDNCPYVANTHSGGDADQDGIGDVCDNCPYVANIDQVNFQVSYELLVQCCKIKYLLSLLL